MVVFRQQEMRVLVWGIKAFKRHKDKVLMRIFIRHSEFRSLRWLNNKVKKVFKLRNIMHLLRASGEDGAIPAVLPWWSYTKDMKCYLQNLSFCHLIILKRWVLAAVRLFVATAESYKHSSQIYEIITLKKDCLSAMHWGLNSMVDCYAIVVLLCWRTTWSISVWLERIGDAGVQRSGPSKTCFT